MTASLSQYQKELLQSLGTNFETGLSSAEAHNRRHQASSDGHSSYYNTVNPPIDCPSWVCCLLPCIKHVPSMKAFRKLQPDDAEVLRSSKWTRYDAASVVVGDVVRLVEGDVVPADAVVLALGTEDLLVDLRGITGEDKPRSIVLAKKSGDHDDSGDKETETTNDDDDKKRRMVYYGGLVLHGSGMAVVTAVGSQTLLARLIRQGKFPPNGTNVLDDNCYDAFNMMDRGGGHHDDNHTDDEDDDDEEKAAGISLISRSGNPPHGIAS